MIDTVIPTGTPMDMDPGSVWQPLTTELVNHPDAELVPDAEVDQKFLDIVGELDNLPEMNSSDVAMHGTKGKSGKDFLNDGIFY